MKSIKKTLPRRGAALLLALCCVFSFAACTVETPEQHQKNSSSAVSASSGPGGSSGSQSSSQPPASGGEAPQEASEPPAPEQPDEAPASQEEPADAPAPSSDPEPTGGQAPDSPPPSSAQPPASEAEEREPPPEPQASAVTVSVLCGAAVGHEKLPAGITLPEDGAMASGVFVEIQEGDSAFSALQSACSSLGLSLDYSGSPQRSAYVRGIGGLYERDCGAASGWIFSVNGSYPNTSSSNVALNDGDNVVFEYTLN